MPAAEAADDPIGEAEFARLVADRGGGGVLLAVSGGPDSMALLHLAARWAQPRPDAHVEAATFDHRLRADSAADVAFVADACRRLGVRHHTGGWDDRPASGNFHHAARLARYAFLIGVARQAGLATIATAHQLDDQAETIVMRRARGATARRLGGIAPSIDVGGGVLIVRPLLGQKRRRLAATLARLGGTARDDPSNHDPRFERSRVRATLVHQAADGEIVETLAGIAERSRREAEATEVAAIERLRAVLVGADGDIDGPATLLDPPDDVALAVLRRVVLAVGGHAEAPSRRNLDALLASLREAVTKAGPLRLKAGARTLGHVAFRIVEPAGSVADGAVRRVHAIREPGRNLPPPCLLVPGVPTLWDGRFLVIEAPRRDAARLDLVAWGQVAQVKGPARRLPTLLAEGRLVGGPAAVRLPDLLDILPAQPIIGERLLDPGLGGLPDRLRLAGHLLPVWGVQKSVTN